MLRLQLLLLMSIIGIGILATVFALSSFGIYSSGISEDDSKKIVSSGNNRETRTTTTTTNTIMTPFGVYKTTGDILDPTSQQSSGKKIVIDPMKYLRAFNYGQGINSA